MNDASEQSSAMASESSSKTGASWIIKVAVLLAIGAAAFFVYKTYGDSLNLETLVSKESQLRQYKMDSPLLVYSVALVVYVLVTGLSLPGASVMTLAYGWYFGFFRGLILVSFASTAGATLAFLLSRYFLRDFIQNKFGDKLKSFNESLEREGAFYLFTLRLIPAVPFFVINVVMGLTPLKTWTYWWVSQLGMLAGTIVYVYAGSQFPDLKTLAETGPGGILTPGLFAAFVALGLFPLVVKKLMAKFRPASP